jgi:Ser/Thr protein kinase RdoA (MazF antagonist)
MPTPDQIEAVARAIWTHDLHQGGVSYTDPLTDAQHDDYRALAQAAIAAYEATRPAVPSDGELLRVFDGRCTEFWNSDAGRNWLGTDEEHRVRNKAKIAGIRAVRERIEGADHE